MCSQRCNVRNNFVCRITGTRLHGIFLWQLKNLVIVMFWRHNIIFCSRLKIHRKICLKKVTLKSGCLNCNVRNTLSSAHTFKVLRANQSIFLLGTKGTLILLSRYVWTPLMNILTSKLGFKILILVSERNVRNMESPYLGYIHSFFFSKLSVPLNEKLPFSRKRLVSWETVVLLQWRNRWEPHRFGFINWVERYLSEEMKLTLC